MPDPVLTSAANPRLKALVALRRRRDREQRGTTVVEGFEELSLAIDAGIRPYAVYYCPELMTEPDSQLDLVTTCRDLGADGVRVARAAFERTAYRQGPDGFLAEVPQPGLSLDALEPGDHPLVLVAEGIEKPGNLGAMLRTADATGAVVIAADPVTDWGNPNVVRASKGTVFSVPVAAGTLAQTLDWLDRHRIPAVVTTPDTDLRYTGADLTGPVAIFVGTEKQGLTDEALAAGRGVRIPMRGQANSLNVATSAALLLYEAVRQRESPDGLAGRVG